MDELSKAKDAKPEVSERPKVSKMAKEPKMAGMDDLGKRDKK